ncbi:MAG: pantoate--beta-alanine ligase [Candidatus Omnitrophica bacterium]|nr:pantoate--beta-alanine ligase [Candidatus Omnitrophota bacterium]
MQIIDNIPRMSMAVKLLKKEGRTIGFVPTMGYLHEGHLSLARTAKKHNDVVVMSIFVNPIQFGPKEDLDKYPRDFKRDEEMARGSGVDILFYPSAKEMYPDGYSTYVNVEKLTDGLCGASRPGHFRGVTTVAAKLFGIVKPDIAYFGQKDAQQAIVIRKMTEDLNMGIDIKILPIVREPDGLAMSSRNIFLSKKERRDAAVLYESLVSAKELIEKGEKSADRIIKAMEALIKSAPSAKIDYVSIVSAKNLKPLNAINQEALVAVAAYVGKTRLIDNILVNQMKSA